MSSERFLDLCHQESETNALPYLYYSTNLERFKLVLVYSTKVYRILGEGRDGYEIVSPNLYPSQQYQGKFSIYSRPLSLPCNDARAIYCICSEYENLLKIERAELRCIEIPREFLSLPTSEEQIEMLDKIILALHL